LKSRDEFLDARDFVFAGDLDDIVRDQFIHKRFRILRLVDEDPFDLSDKFSEPSLMEDRFVKEWRDSFLFRHRFSFPREIDRKRGGNCERSDVPGKGEFRERIQETTGLDAAMDRVFRLLDHVKHQTVSS
jgi:hypothetical protein